MAWEEAPLLDDVSVSAGYRATIVNLGLVGVRYDKLAEYIDMDAVNPSVDHLTGHLDPRYASGDR
ncbi:MAG: hypothetical protein HY815_24915 [Candidatus Riflebacteria bacterium]|nr:hypothetical protein [Candidatus Riflebacteria bacterium]